MLINLQVVNAICENADPVLTTNVGLSIEGQVRVLGVSTRCQVRLFEKVSGRLVASVVTNHTGHYEFDHLTKTKFYLVSHHPASQYNAVIQDNVVPK